MKKAISGLILLLFALTGLYPAGTLIAACFGYNFEVINVPVFSVIIALLSVCAVILDLVFKYVNESKPIQVLMVVIAPLSLLNAVFCIFECPKIAVAVSAFVSFACCCFLTVKHGEPLVLKALVLVLSGLMVLPISFLCFIALIFGDFGKNTVTQTVESPSGKYYARVIDSDQGALGGDTFVDVYEKKGINAIIFKIEKKPQRIYSGDWGEFEYMEIHWEDDGCLMINSVEYEIE